ncbi:DUF1835 domain-containing protein [Bacillus gobiensis]|uniref:DUF1835 domain-containing protein n=1 Tax=Bacillus gobiensis TaxID=1441095 RepID=A0A0M5JHE0_9BACI|nr:DUF1835 domain-containing protein [Bacillus gobiensis]ALC83727.1 hypothetical protein AM592_21030 [Bacillus gobiensis]
MIDELKKAIIRLSEEEAKSLLFTVLLQGDLLKDLNEELAKQLNKTTESLLNYHKQKNQKEKYSKVHVAFSHSTSGSLKAALNHPRDEKVKVIPIDDQFSYGPIWQLHQETGKECRWEWLNDNINYEEGELDDQIRDNKEKINELLQVPEGIPIFIWTGSNAHEQIGVRYALYHLREKRNDVYLMNVDEKYRRTGEVSAEKLKEMYEKQLRNKPLSNEEKQAYINEWLGLANTKDVLRIWKNGEIQLADVSRYDRFIINLAKKLHNERGEHSFMKSARLIGEAIGQIDQNLDDLFFEYRVRSLILQGVFDIKGIPKAMRFYSVKLRSDLKGEK